MRVEPEHSGGARMPVAAEKRCQAPWDSAPCAGDRFPPGQREATDLSSSSTLIARHALIVFLSVPGDWQRCGAPNSGTVESTER